MIKYIISSIFLSFIVCFPLNAADNNEVVDQNHIQYLPHEALFNVFSQLPIENVRALRLTSKRFNTSASDASLIKRLIEQSSRKVKKQVIIGLTFLPKPLFCSLYREKKDKKMSGKITNRLLNITISKTIPLSLVSRALVARAERSGLPVEKIAAINANEAIKNNDVEMLKRFTDLGARPQDVNQNDLTAMYGRLFSDAINAKKPMNALQWLDMGAEPTDQDYKVLCKLYEANSIALSSHTVAISLKTMRETSNGKIEYSHLKKNSAYFDLLTKIVGRGNVPQDYKKTIGAFRDLSEFSQKKLKKFEKQ